MFAKIAPGGGSPKEMKFMVPLRRPAAARQRSRGSALTSAFPCRQLCGKLGPGSQRPGAEGGARGVSAEKTGEPPDWSRFQTGSGPKC